MGMEGGGVVPGNSEEAKALQGEGREWSKSLTVKKNSVFLWTRGEPGWSERSGRRARREKELRVGGRLRGR